MKKPPMLDTLEIIKLKTEMLDNLLEIEVAYSLMKGGEEGEDPVDAHYKKLKTEIEVGGVVLKKGRGYVIKPLGG